jgi:3-hydroxyisobutyrate dehydrogenase-like beta-hydroxyacid dehydrogenase
VANKLSKLSQLNSKSLTYVECNAISPDTTKFIEKSFTATAFKNSKYIDGSIIGTAPTNTYKPKLYISGKYANEIEFLKSKAFQIINLGDKLEAASSIKMCYASLTKGTNALWISLLLLSKKLNIFDELIEELDYSQKDTLIKMKNQIPKLPLKSGRWIAEMREIASTYVSQSLNSGSLDNSAYIYSLVSLIENKEIKDLSNLMDELNINSK